MEKRNISISLEKAREMLSSDELVPCSSKMRGG